MQTQSYTRVSTHTHACTKYNGRDYSTVDGRSRRKCYWTRASFDCGRLQIGDVTREVEFLSNDYTNPNTNPKTLTTLALTLTDHHDALESFCAPVFCDFVRNYSCTVEGAVVTSKYNIIMARSLANESRRFVEAGIS